MLYCTFITIILSSYAKKGMYKKKSRLNFMSSVGFQASKFGCFFENFLLSYLGNHFQAEVVP